MAETRVVSKKFPDVYKTGQDNSSFLRQLRTAVQEIKCEDPTLLSYHLYDLGFAQHEDGLEVKMYFAD